MIHLAVRISKICHAQRGFDFQVGFAVQITSVDVTDTLQTSSLCIVKKRLTLSNHVIPINCCRKQNEPNNAWSEECFFDLSFLRVVRDGT